METMCGGARPAAGARERGASSLEYLGAILVGTLVTLGLVVAAPGWGQQITRTASTAVCTVAQHLGGSVGCSVAGSTAAGAGEESEDPYRDRRWTRGDVTRGGVVFIGDSYGAGEGARDYDPATDQTGEQSWWDRLRNQDVPPKNMCHRSDNAAYHVVKDSWFSGNDGTFASCSGARTGDYWGETQGNSEDPQRDALTKDTSLVVVSMGGNDMQFAAVLTSCAPVGSGSVKDCIGHWDGPSDPDDPDSQSRWEQNLAELFGTEPGGGTLGDVYDDIRGQTGDNAHVVVMGYPQIFDENYPGGVFSREEAAWMNEKSVLLNEALRAHAEHYGFTFIDPTEAFDGHGVGSDDPWILTFGFWGDHRAQPPEAYHPTADGQRAIGELVNDHITHLPTLPVMPEPDKIEE